METNFEIVQKENIHALKFPKNEVLQLASEMQERFNDLRRALYLGNIEHAKIKIFFEDSLSKKVVETTVWAVTDTSVILKRGVGIPIHRIYYSC